MVILLASILSRDRYILAIERHAPNYGSSEKSSQNNKTVPRLKRFFKLSSKAEQPTARTPRIREFKVWIFTFKFVDTQEDIQPTSATDDPSTTASQKIYISVDKWAEEEKKRQEKHKSRDKIEKTREHMREKYNIP